MDHEPQTAPVTSVEPLIRYRAVFISDLHIGSVGCKAEAADHFLRSAVCERLYLVGDIFDAWVGARDKKWKQAQSNLARTILSMSNQGTSVLYCPGNHDSFLRRLLGAEFGNTLVEHSFDHTTAKGERLLIVHGDRFDKTITNMHPVAYVAAWAHELSTMATHSYNVKRSRRGRAPVDYSGSLKKGVKRFISRATSFEDELIRAAKNKGYGGVICGHVHRPRLQRQEDGFLYGNSGDWVEHCTAIVEHLDGRLELLWFDAAGQPTAPPNTGEPQARS